MFVHRSNRLERLVDQLAEVVRRPLADPLARETIVVEGRGIERWLARCLADRLGVCANATFPFPRGFLMRAFGLVLGDETDPDPFEPNTLAWSVAVALGRLGDRPEFAPVSRYLDAQPGPRSLIALSRRIARVLDQYAVYRPDWIAEWERGREDHWQAALWRDVTAGREQHHVAARARQFLEKIATADLDGLPPRISLFGLSTLAPLYLECFAALARRIEVHLFLHSPSPLYWADIRNQREVLRERRKRGESADDAETEILAAAGNPMLASFGGVGRDFQAVLVERDDYDRFVELENWDAPAPDTMLHALQRDVFDVIDRRSPEYPKLDRDPADDSIQIHSCHGPMRELQVLHDRLRDMFERDRTLQPHEVVVLCPDIDAYAPLVEAVFGAGSTNDDPAAAPTTAIPFRVADRRVRERDEIVDAFLRYLAALESRLTATDVVGLIDTAPIRERFEIAEADIAPITSWVRDAAIRWAADAEDRARNGQPALAEHTWRFGLERLFLGFAMEAADGEPVAGRVPAGEIEPTTAVTLGIFAGFCETLFHWHDEIRLDRPVEDWSTTLSDLVDGVLTQDRTRHDQRQTIRDALQQIAQSAANAGFTDVVDLATMRALLEEELERGAPGRDFLTGSVTFCAMVPMRSVPFRVVCLLGMNDEGFPRRERNPGFDRMAQRKRLGDRSPRDDDRYLFLEAVLAAREKLIVTYVGRDQQDNAERPPSTVVSELLDVLDATFKETNEGDVSRSTTIEHPLQPFSPRYFDRSDERLWSYSQANLAGARTLLGGSDAHAPFVLVRGPLPVDEERVPPATIDRLARFLENPARTFLRNRLGLVLVDDDATLEDREPVALDGLEKWKIGDAILARGAGSEASFRAAGELPPGSLGSLDFAEVRTTAESILAASAALRCATALEPVLIDTVVAGEPVTGILDSLWPEGLVHVQFAKANAGRLLGLWVRHLFLCHQRPPDCAPVSTLVSRGADGPQVQRLRTVDDPLPILEQLVALYRRGHAVPIPLFPLASRAWCEAVAKDRENPLYLAQRCYVDDYGKTRGDADDPSIAAVFGRDARVVVREDPIFADATDVTFTAIAAEVFDPLLAHLDTVEPGGAA